MAHENILSTVPTFTIDSDGYFCSFNTTINIFQKTTQTGNVVFTYPSTEAFLSGDYGELIDICYDGSNFWTLNREGSTRQNWPAYGGYVYNYSIKKWTITNNVVTKTAHFDYVNLDINDVFVPTSFSVEAYKTTYSTTVSGNNLYVKMTDYWDSPRLESGDTLFLGPNSAGQSEYVTVTGTVSPNTVGINFYTSHTYEAGDDITFNKVIYVFNKFNSAQYGDSTDGSLMSFNPLDGLLESTVIDAEYKNITASTFSYITAVSSTPNFYSIVYIKDNTTKFINIDTMTVEIFMIIDNIQADSSTTIVVESIEVHNNSLYRLQLRSMYYEADYVWATYNYVLSPIREYLDTITTTVSPKVLPSNGASTAVVTAITKDQYNDTMTYTQVSFEDDNDTGYIAISPVATDSLGVANTSYFSGVSPATVTITATALEVVADV